MRNGHVLHHISKRKRANNKELKAYPHPNKWIRLLDKLMIFIAILSPVMTIPQIWKIFYYQNAAGVSGITWGSYVIINVPWLLYGLVHKEKVIIINTCLWLVINSIVTIGAILY